MATLRAGSCRRFRQLRQQSPRICLSSLNLIYINNGDTGCFLRLFFSYSRSHSIFIRIYTFYRLSLNVIHQLQWMGWKMSPVCRLPKRTVERRSKTGDLDILRLRHLTQNDRTPHLSARRSLLAKTISALIQRPGSTSVVPNAFTLKPIHSRPLPGTIRCVNPRRLRAWLSDLCECVRPHHSRNVW